MYFMQPTPYPRPTGIKPQAIRYPKSLRHEVTSLVIDQYQYAADVAKAYGLVERTVYNWVRRERQLRQKNLTKMADTAQQRIRRAAESLRDDVLHDADKECWSKMLYHTKQQLRHLSERQARRAQQVDEDLNQDN